jgi:mannose-6-phosphate isomerase-like protein (cupin superfamily)
VARERATSATNEAGCTPLARLTVDPESFVRDIWGRRADLAERRGPFEDVFSLGDADDLLARAVRPPSVRMVRDGTVIDAAEYCVSTRLGGQIVPQVVEPRKVADLVAGGATLVLQSLHRQWPALTTFIDELTKHLGHPCQANAYLTPPGGSGLTTHADEHDVFAVQLEGSKRWWVDGFGDLRMSGGDVLYVPAGCRHGAQAEHSSSLHLTIGVLRVTYRQVVERMLREPCAELDAPLPVGYRDAGGAAATERFELGLRQAVAAALAHLESVDVARTVDAERRRAISPYDRGGHLWSVVHAEGIDTDSTIRWAAASPQFVDLPNSADGRAWVRLQLTDRALRVPAAARGPIRRLADCSSMRVGDLPELDPASQRTLARRLVEERACVITDAAQA